MLDPSLHTAYVVGQNASPLAPCRHCNESDHSSEDCALAPLLPAPAGAKHPPTTCTRNPPEKSVHLSYTWESALFRSQRWLPERFAYHGTGDMFISRYKHTCAMCDSLGHQAKDCTLTPPDSIYKQPPRRSDLQPMPH